MYLTIIRLKLIGLIFGMNEDIWFRFWMDNGYTKNRTGAVGGLPPKSLARNRPGLSPSKKSNRFSPSDSPLR